MKPFDVHCHIYAKDFDKDRAQVIERAKKVIWGAINSGENIKSNRMVLELAKEYPKFLWPALAIHPSWIYKYSDEEIEKEIEFIRGQKIIAIGEAGLDYFWIKKILPSKIGAKKASEEKQRQINTFKKFIELAKELDLPLVVHSRWATKAVIEVLEALKPEKVILHAFFGSISEAKRALTLGYKFSIGNTIAYAQQKRDLAKHLELKDLLLETDSPVLGPVKGERNEPVNIKFTIKEIAKIKNVPEEKVIEITNQNIKNLFGIQPI